MLSQSLLRLGDRAYAIFDRELVLLLTDTTTLNRPELIGLSFKTATGCWRCLRLGTVDIGFVPDAPSALEKLVKDAAANPGLFPDYPMASLGDLEITVDCVPS